MTDDDRLDDLGALDDLGRRAGAELRRPAPAGGLAGVRRSHRRRRNAVAAAATAAVIAVAGGTIALANRGGDDSIVTEEPSVPTRPTPTTQPTGTVDSVAPPMDLDGTWWLIEVDGEQIVPGVNTIGVPEVIIGDGTLFAYFGCNSGAALDPVFDDGRLLARGGLEMSAQLCSIPDGSDEMVLSERVLVAMLEAGVDWTVDGDTMTWTGNGSVATFTRDEDELPSVLPTLPATLPTAPDTTAVIGVDPTGTWWLTDVGGGPVQYGADMVEQQPWLRLGVTGVVGYLGCNQAAADGYTIEGDRLVIDGLRTGERFCAVDGTVDEMVFAESELVAMLDEGLRISIEGDRMTWISGERSAIFVRSVDGSEPQRFRPSPLPTPAVFDVSDEPLPDADDFGGDGFLRELIDRSIVVRSNPEVVIPIEVADDMLWLLGVGPDDVAYVQTATGPDAVEFGRGPNRLLAIPTAGPNAGEIYELFALQEIPGAWGFTMEVDGIDHLDLSDDAVPIPFVDSSGASIGGEDPTLTWTVAYETVSDGPFDVLVTVTERASGRSFDAPLLAVGSEGNRPRPIRPLPDGRVVVVLEASTESDEIDDRIAAFALDPATGTWTRHPWS